MTVQTCVCITPCIILTVLALLFDDWRKEKNMGKAISPTIFAVNQAKLEILAYHLFSSAYASHPKRHFLTAYLLTSLQQSHIVGYHLAQMEQSLAWRTTAPFPFQVKVGMIADTYKINAIHAHPRTPDFNLWDDMYMSEDVVEWVLYLYFEE